MGWSIGYDERWKRDIGYGVPAFCDHPDCNEVIDRGLSYVCCNQQPYGGDNGCGLYFCELHLGHYSLAADGFACVRCANDEPPFDAKPDHSDWIKHKATDPSWAKWREIKAQEKKRDE